MSLPEIENPKVSIIFTLFNAERFIQASMNAALQQDYPNYEVVVLDDGSTDRTGGICLSVKDPRLKYFKRERIGRQRALNEAISLAQGEYIAINDADDLSFPYRLSYCINFIKNHDGIAFIATDYAKTERFMENIPSALLTYSVDSTAKEAVWPSRVTVYRRTLFVNSTLIFPKTVWKMTGGYDETLSLNEDYDFQLRSLQFGKVAILPQKTILWYTNPDGFFKKKSEEDYLKTLAVIKKRAFRLLNLPFWIKPYHPLWVQIYKTIGFFKKARFIWKVQKRAKEF